MPIYEMERYRRVAETIRVEAISTSNAFEIGHDDDIEPLAEDDGDWEVRYSSIREIKE